MRQAEREDSSLRSEINVTPLADVMLVLLIIFMVITPLLGGSVDVADIPDAAVSSEHPDNEETLTLALRRDGSIFLGKDPLTRTELQSTLTRRLETRSDKVVYVKASEGLDYGYVFGIMDDCRRAGAPEVALITRKENR